MWPREETLSCCCVPSPAQSPILTTSASWTWSWSGFPPRPFFHWISGSKPQLNQVYGNNQILIYPKVFNPYWWFLFALFVQKCKWALNKGGRGGEVSYYRCHINTDFLISISDNNDTSVTFVNVLIVDWGKIFSECNESYPEREEFEHFFVSHTEKKKYEFLLLIASTWTKSDNLPSPTSCVEICRLDSVLIGSFDHWLNIYDVFYRPAKIGNQLFYLIF